jgi:hypothetical protein
LVCLTLLEVYAPFKIFSLLIRALDFEMKSQARKIQEGSKVGKVADDFYGEDGRLDTVEDDEDFAYKENDDDYEDDLLAAECIFVGHAWDRPQQFGTCFYHCRDHGELDDEESGLDLDELLATRKEALWRAVTMRDGQESRAPTESAAAAATAGAAGVAAGAAVAPSVLGQLWDEPDEGRAARTLLSFAAAATLGPLERLEALLMTDASSRLQFALEKLTEQQETLASMLVLVKKEAARSGRF